MKNPTVHAFCDDLCSFLCQKQLLCLYNRPLAVQSWLLDPVRHRGLITRNLETAAEVPSNAIS